MNLEASDIRLFLKNETTWDHNKYILNEATKCEITETIDGIFDLELEYPLNDNKKLSGLLVRENVIKCAFSQTDSRGEQLFTIRKRSVNTNNNKITIYAQAKARRDFDMNMVLGLEVPAGQTRKQACQQLLSKCVINQGYSIGNLDTSTNTSINLGLEEETGNVINYLDISGTSVLKAFLSDSENSIFKAYGGEIIFNNKVVNMVDERGTDFNILIESEKNLEELQQDIDDTDTENFATAVLPCSSDGFYLPNSEIIYSSNVANLGVVFKKIAFDDVSLKDDTTEAYNAVYAQLREKTQKKFAEGLDKLKINNTIKYVQLLNTEEYKAYRNLFAEKCEIGNNVTVRYYMKNDKTQYIDAVGRVVKIKFNVLKNRIEEIEIGDRKKKSVLDTITSAVNNVSNVNSKTNTNKTNIKKKAKEAKVYTDTTKDGLTTFIGETRTGILFEVSESEKLIGSRIELTEKAIALRVKSVDYNAYVEVTDRAITERVMKGDGFGTELTLHSDEIIQTIHGATDNSVILNSSGLHVVKGGFDFEDDHGNHILTARTTGGIQLGDDSWSRNDCFEKIYAGQDQLGFLFQLSYIAINAELDMGSYNINTDGTIYAGALEVDSGGTKNCAHKTEHFGTVLINAYETAEYYFGDIGEGTIINGECTVPIEPVFSECVNTSVPYQVFLQSYNGNITSVERLQDKFIVKGTENTNFAWEIKAKRIGFENTRLALSKRQ